MRTATRRKATGWEIQKGGDGYIPKEKTKSRVKQRDVTSFLRINSGRVTGVTNPKRANRRRDPSRSGEQIGHCSCKRATRTVHANINQLHRLRKKCASHLRAFHRNSTFRLFTFVFLFSNQSRTCQWSAPWLPRLSLTGRVCDHKSDFQSVLLSLLMPLSFISTYSYRIPTIYRVCVL